MIICVFKKPRLNKTSKWSCGGMVGEQRTYMSSDDCHIKRVCSLSKAARPNEPSANLVLAFDWYSLTLSVDHDPLRWVYIMTMIEFSSSPTLKIAITVAGLGIHRIRMGWVSRKQLKLCSRSTTVYIILLHSVDSYTVLSVPQPQGHKAGVSLGIRSMENTPPRSQQAWAHWRVNFMDPTSIP